MDECQHVTIARVSGVAFPPYVCHEGGRAISDPGSRHSCPQKSGISDPPQIRLNQAVYADLESPSLTPILDPLLASSARAGAAPRFRDSDRVSGLGTVSVPDSPSIRCSM